MSPEDDQNEILRSICEVMGFDQKTGKEKSEDRWYADERRKVEAAKAAKAAKAANDSREQERKLAWRERWATGEGELSC